MRRNQPLIKTYTAEWEEPVAVRMETPPGAIDGGNGEPLVEMPPVRLAALLRHLVRHRKPLNERNIPPNRIPEMA